jgi:hypothetical protein
MGDGSATPVANDPRKGLGAMPKEDRRASSEGAMRSHLTAQWVGRNAEAVQWRIEQGLAQPMDQPPTNGCPGF